MNQEASALQGGEDVTERQEMSTHTKALIMTVAVMFLFAVYGLYVFTQKMIVLVMP